MMKRIFSISAILTGILLILFIAGIVDFHHPEKKALAKGDRLYTAGDYERALAAYQEGLQHKPDDPRLNFNSGQACYRLKDYQNAMGYYNKSRDRIEKYLNAGNSCLMLGDASSDDNQKMQLYQQALQIYQQGILKFPENVSLKYNYEYVKQKIDQTTDNSQDQQNDQDQQEDQNQQEDQKQQDDQNQQGDQEQQEDQKSQQGDQEQQSGEDQQDNTNEGSSSGSAQDDEQSDPQDSQEASGIQDYAEIEQALKALEKQEEESLKNNQGTIEDDREDPYDW